MQRPFDYVHIPDGAQLLRDNGSIEEHTVSLPETIPSASTEHLAKQPQRSELSTPGSPESKHTHRRSSSSTSSFLVSQTLTQVLNIPALPSELTDCSSHAMLTTKYPLSLPITTVNFRRFVARSGAIFWFQDRIEEILLWKRGQKYTSVFMAAYAFVCIFPQTILAVPLVITLSLILAEPDGKSLNTDSIPPFPSLPSEGSAEWFANLQAIQNLLGAVSEAYDFIAPLIASQNLSAQVVFPFIVVIAVCLILPLFVPIKVIFLLGGLVPMVLGHPFVFPLIVFIFKTNEKTFITHWRKFRDDDRLSEHHWQQGLHEVELWENERWDKEKRVWATDAERKRWTRGADGWSPVNGEGSVSSNLTFVLEPGWTFVESEDWKEDLNADWAGSQADQKGWVYTNNAWQDLRGQPLEEWYTRGMTRRRRWTRRVYYKSSV